jgi:membrane-associated protein
LFAAGALAATGAFQIGYLFITVFTAAVCGDAANYHIGKYLGPKVFSKESSLIFHKEYLTKAQSFYNKKGAKTIILARFIPVIRTFAPFVAGIGKMPYRTFLIYNIIGAAIWSGLFTFGGYLFGNIPWVKDHFSILVIAIIIVSLVPLAKEIIVHFLTNKKPKSSADLPLN